MKRLVVLGAVMLLSGCAADARNEMLTSKAALKACLAQHAQDVNACSAAMIAFRADLVAYAPMTATADEVAPERPIQAPLVTQQPTEFAPFAAR
jgi:outer membrane murein-binding lipoprotein Lpp